MCFKRRMRLPLLMLLATLAACTSPREAPRPVPVVMEPDIVPLTLEQDRQISARD